MEDFLKSVNKSKFANNPYVKKVPKPWGYENHFTPDDLPYMGKILHIDAGKRLSLQVHDQKVESWFKLKGKVVMIIVNTQVQIQENEMEDIQLNTIKLRQSHLLTQIEQLNILQL